MNTTNSIAKLLITAGIILVITGIMLLFFSKKITITGLPCDIYVKKGNISFYFPITTCIVLSLLISIAVKFLSKK
ncbi:MAG: DUF2905 domain-containing protein [Elusimicrobiales bacterium]|jgi:hypothetical protein|nr:DUF2905 domain-containing protein [Elusimicrobiales bacterium]